MRPQERFKYCCAVEKNENDKKIVYRNRFAFGKRAEAPQCSIHDSRARSTLLAVSPRSIDGSDACRSSGAKRGPLKLLQKQPERHLRCTRSGGSPAAGCSAVVAALRDRQSARTATAAHGGCATDRHAVTVVLLGARGRLGLFCGPGGGPVG